MPTSEELKNYDRLDKMFRAHLKALREWKFYWLKPWTWHRLISANKKASYLSLVYGHKRKWYEFINPTITYRKVAENIKPPRFHP